MPTAGAVGSSATEGDGSAGGSGIGCLFRTERTQSRTVGSGELESSRDGGVEDVGSMFRSIFSFGKASTGPESGRTSRRAGYVFLAR